MGRALLIALLAGSALAGPASASNVVFVCFSPDGRIVAFERAGSVFTVPVAGGPARRLLWRAREPSWSR